MKRVKQFFIMSIFSIGFVSSIFIMNMHAAGSNQNNSIDITEKDIIPFKYPMTFIVKFSNIIYEEKGKNIKIPVFQGNLGEVKYKDLIKYCIDKKYIDQYMWVSYIVKCKKGKVRQTLHEFLKFYKSNILKDVNIEKPTVMSLSSTEWTIKYDFTIENIPCYLEIQFDSQEKDVDNNPKYKSVYDINPEENVKDPNILYTFIIGAKSKK